MEDYLTLIYQNRIEELIRETNNLESITEIISDLVISYSKIKKMSVEQGLDQLVSDIIKPLVAPILTKIILQQTRITKTNKLL